MKKSDKAKKGNYEPTTYDELLEVCMLQPNANDVMEDLNTLRKLHALVSMKKMKNDMKQLKKELLKMMGECK